MFLDIAVDVQAMEEDRVRVVVEPKQAYEKAVGDGEPQSEPQVNHKQTK